MDDGLPKIVYAIVAAIGSAIFGYIPRLWGGSTFSFASVLCGSAGAILLIWIAYKLHDNGTI